MKEESFSCWRDFVAFLEQLQGMRKTTLAKGGGSVSSFLFRGQGSDDWPLQTTLERSPGNPWSLSRYFRLVSIARPQTETFTGRSWDLADWPELEEWSRNYDNLHIRQFPGYDYLVFLRHHGFPSPLLDWTRSPYIAAYFAFAHPRSEHVAIFVYWEYTGHGKVGASEEPQIIGFGPYVRSHSRHYLQQSEYTIAAKYEEGEWGYVSHEDIFSSGSTTQDRLWKCSLPASERLEVLRYLDAHNINAFSLFQSDETLLETIALRELELSEKDL